LEWDLPAGLICRPMHTHMLILIPTAYPTQCGRGSVVGDEAEAEVAGLVGDGLCPTGIHGGKTRKYNFVRRLNNMWHWHGYYYPRSWGFPEHWCAPPLAWPWAAPISKEQETAILEEQAKILESELERIKKRLEEIKK
jgi:hypothetical protein